MFFKYLLNWRLYLRKITHLNLYWHLTFREYFIDTVGLLLTHYLWATSILYVLAKAYIKIQTPGQGRRSILLSAGARVKVRVRIRLGVTCCS